MKIAIINGPNLNLLGQREPELYGNESFESYFQELCQHYPTIELVYYQSNSEGSLIDKIQQWGFECDGLIINAGGYSHTSIAMADAVRSVPAESIEVHLTNIMRREPYRHISYLSEASIGSIFGFGLDSYRLAIEALLKREL